MSLLGYERIEAFKRLGADVQNGSFGENIIVEGYDLKSLPIGTRFVVGDAVLELTQVGKQCHKHCAIYHKMGDCIMPREGVFCRVIKGGRVCAGDSSTPSAEKRGRRHLFERFLRLCEMALQNMQIYFDYVR